MVRKASFTETGLPLDQISFGAPSVATTTGSNDDAGPARRIDCRSPALVLAAPSLRPTGKRLPSRRAISLRANDLRRSLIDDDDDELIDFFDRDHLMSGPALVVGPVRSDTAIASSPWNVRDNNVPTLPSCYPLEKSVVFVPQASAPDLAARIVAVLKARSIWANYDAKNAKVDCITNSHVDFRVRLYRGRGEYNHGIIVEVQRQEGFELGYSQDVHAILDAAEGKSNTYDMDSLPNHYVESDEGSCSSEEEDMDSLETTAGLASLRVISDILCPPAGENKTVSIEGRDFALASLASLTCLDRMGQVAIQHSNQLVSSEEYAALRQAVLSNLSQDLKHTPQRPMLQSLEILANVAALSTQGSSPLVHLLSQNDNAILINLIINVENSQLNPRAADLSCVVLKNTYGPTHQEDTMMTLQYRERLTLALMEAVGYGSVCYAGLEKSSRQCLEIMM